MPTSLTTSLPFVTLDVFTTQRFGGNPLAVVFDAQARLDTARMQAIAREFNFSETTFVRPPSHADHDAQVRIFTPAFEMPWAGHPNVGTAWALALRGGMAGQSRVFHFEELAGRVRVDVQADSTGLIDARVTAPQALAVTPAPDGAVLARCLGLTVDDLDAHGPAPQAASVGFPFPMLALRTRDALARAKPDAGLMAQVLPAYGLDGLVAFTRQTIGDDQFDGTASDLSVRMFAPLAGVPEDPATGAACAGLTAWLTQHDIDAGRWHDGVRRLRIAQGIDMRRPSLIIGEAKVAGGILQAVTVGGACVPVMRGEIEV